MPFDHFVSAFRSLRKSKIFLLVNSVGLTIGISACAISYLITVSEFTIDTFQPDFDRIYRVYTRFTEAGGRTTNGVATAVVTQIRNRFTGVENACNFHTYYASVEIPSPSGNKDFDFYEKIAFADSNYFNVFSHYNWLYGNSRESLSRPFSVVLTETRAKAYFGDESIEKLIGKEVVYNDSLTVTVSGIISDFNDHTDFYFTDFISINTISRSWLKKMIQFESWNAVNSSSQLFIKLAPSTATAHVQEQLTRLDDIVFGLYKYHWRMELALQPLADLHSNATLGVFDYSPPVIEKTSLYILLAISLVILLIAIFNYINLYTAFNLERRKEIGIKKILGISKFGLVTQSLLQSFLLVSFSVSCALLLVALIIGYFNQLIPPRLAIDFVSFFVFLFSCLLGVTLLAGIYPALILSSVNPIQAISNRTFFSRAFVRKGLVVAQYAFSAILITVLLAMRMQTNFLFEKDLGFSSDSILFFGVPRNEPPDKKTLLKTRLEQLPMVKAVSISPPPIYANAGITIGLNNGKEIIRSQTRLLYVDTLFLEFYNLDLIA